MINLDRLACCLVCYYILLCFGFFSSTFKWNLLNNSICKFSKISWPSNKKKFNKFKPSSSMFCLFSGLLCYCATVYSFFYLRLYAIYQMILIVSFIRYLDRLTMKKLMNLDNLSYYCHYIFILLCNSLLDFLYLHLHAIY